MVRVINIDTKTRTIRVSNEDKDIDWITVKGTHVPIKKGESKGEAVEKFFEDKGRKFYRGSVVHKSGIDRQNIEVAEIRDRLKQWEHKLKKADTDGEKEFIKKAQEKLRKNLDYSKGVIKELSGDFEIDPYDKDMLKEFDDWKKSKQPAKKAKETYADTSEIDGAEVFKDGDDYVVLYANGTKSREFTSKTEADKFAKSLSEQPAKQEPYSDPFHKEAEQKRNAAKDAWLKAKPQIDTKKLRAGDPETFEKYLDWRWQATSISDGYDEMMKDFGSRDGFVKAAIAYEKLKKITRHENSN